MGITRLDHSCSRRGNLAVAPIDLKMTSETVDGPLVNLDALEAFVFIRTGIAAL